MNAGDQPFAALDLLAAHAQLEDYLAEHADDPVVARDIGPLGPRCWTVDRVYCANIPAQHLVSMPRNPPAEAVL